MSVNENKGKTQILVLPANHGDSIIVKTFDSSGKAFNMIIDGGTAKTYNQCLKNEINKLDFIDLLVLTHIDSDHIGGLIKFFKNPFFTSMKIGKYWFNSKNITFIHIGENISYDQAKTLEELLIEKDNVKEKWADDIFFEITPELPAGIEVEILSPTKEVLKELYLKWPDLTEHYYQKLADMSISTIIESQLNRGSLEALAAQEDQPEKSISADIFNSSSIAFIFRTFDLSVLFLGDSHPDLIKQTMNAKGYSKEKKLRVDIVKVSHHGSKNNTSKDILDMIDCDRFVISTNGGSSNHTHPDREIIARIIYHPERVRQNFEKHRKIYLNYPKSVVEQKAGQFVNDLDQLTGNWELVESTNLFENERESN